MEIIIGLIFLVAGGASATVKPIPGTQKITKNDYSELAEMAHAAADLPVKAKNKRRNRRLSSAN